MTKMPNFSPSEIASYETPIRWPNGVSRRSLLLALPLAGTAAPLASFAQAGDTDTPVLRVYREWRQEFARMENCAKAMTDEEFNRTLAEVCVIEERLCALPAQTPTDVLVKLVALTYDGDSVALDGDPRSASVIAEAVRFANAELM